MEPSVTEQAAEIVSACVAHNFVPPAELPNLPRAVHDTLASLGEAAPVEAPAEPPKPAMPLREFVTDEHVIGLEDGRKFESPKRDLAGLGMTPADDRAKWGPAVQPSDGGARRRGEAAGPGEDDRLRPQGGAGDAGRGSGAGTPAEACGLYGAARPRRWRPRRRAA